MLTSLGRYLNGSANISTSTTFGPHNLPGAGAPSKARLAEAFAATVHGVDAAGEAFGVATVLENIGAGGLYLRLSNRVADGAELLIVSKLWRSEDGRNSGPLVAIHGTVLRTENRIDGTCGVAVKFTHKVFL